MALTTTEREPSSYRSTSPGLRLMLLLVLSLSLMILDHQQQTLRGFRTAVSALVYPLQSLVSTPFTVGREAADNLSSRSVLIEENRRLNSRILIQSARLQRMTALEAENARLRALLDSTAKVSDRVLIAEIVSVDTDPFRQRILVNKGSRNGAYVGQALIDADGIVGQITRDQYFGAEVMLVTDLDHAVPVEIARNRLRTIAVGTGQPELLSLPFLPRNADVEPGDLLVTSGLGGTFPPGYPVGVVRNIRSDTGQSFLQIDAEPSAALNRIREVLLVWPAEDVEDLAPRDEQEEQVEDRPTDKTAVETDAVTN